MNTQKTPNKTLLKKIKDLAGKNVTLLGYQKFDILKDHLSRAKAFIFAAEEDFGISPLEAQASGTPVIAFGKGGALETIRGLDDDDPTGLFFTEQTVDNLTKAISLFEKNVDKISAESCVVNAQRFSDSRFRNEFKKLVEDEYKEWKLNI